MKLFSCMLAQSSDCLLNELYIRTNNAVTVRNNCLVLKKGDICSFDTLYNSFPLKKYHMYTQVRNVSVKIAFRGNLQVDLVCAKINHGQITQSTVTSRQLFSEELTEIDIDCVCQAQADNYILFPRFTALDKCELDSVSYQTELEPSEIFCDFVICTYRRKKYAIHNSISLSKQICTLERFRGSVILVDNASEISPELFAQQDNVIIINNSNTGGSGGFGRGAEESLKRGSDYIIFMDDDVEFDANLAEKTVSFLRLLRLEYKEIFLAGTMNYLNEPFKQFETGATVDSQIKLTGINMLRDMRPLQAVLENDIPVKMDVSGWWYMAIPTVMFRRHGLPAPFFIKYDDVEFALRCSARLVSLNGVTVRHELFEKKHMAWLEYYNTRNYLHTWRKYGDGFDNEKLWEYVQAESQKKLNTYDYISLRLFLMGVSDHKTLKKNAEKNHIKLLRYRYRTLNREEISSLFNDEALALQTAQSVDSEFQNALLDTDSDYIAVDAFWFQPPRPPLARVILKYNVFTQTGFILKFSSWKDRLFRIWLRILSASLKSKEDGVTAVKKSW